MFMCVREREGEREREREEKSEEKEREWGGGGGEGNKRCTHTEVRLPVRWRLLGVRAGGKIQVVAGLLRT